MANKKKRRRAYQSNLLVLRLLILVVIVLVIFEGQLIHTMFSQSRSVTVTTSETNAAADDDSGSDTPVTSSASGSANAAALIDQGPSAGLAGFSSINTQAAAGSRAGTGEAETTADTADTEAETIDESIDSDAVVPLQEEKVDDSYFSDAVFIGDSRMEGFRNASGITQGDFLTSIGMAISEISNAQVSTSEGNITVYQGLSGKQYSKIYLMLGANDLGYYTWDTFLDTVESVLDQMHRLQTDAIIYVCSVIYVEEDKTESDYVNNTNVIKVNNYLLQACEDLSYCYYLNLNEIFTDGYQELIPGASADGVHLYAEYLEQMLDYLKSHYIVTDTVSDED